MINQIKHSRQCVLFWFFVFVMVLHFFNNWDALLKSNYFFHRKKKEKDFVVYYWGKMGFQLYIVCFYLKSKMVSSDVSFFDPLPRMYNMIISRWLPRKKKKIYYINRWRKKDFFGTLAILRNLKNSLIFIF